MIENEIKIGYDATAEDALSIALSILDNLGVDYEMSGEETITIKYRQSVIASDINMLWKADKVVNIIHNNKDIYYIGEDYKHEFYITKTKIDNPVRIIHPNHLL